jgi:hypothetical protein
MVGLLLDIQGRLKRIGKGESAGEVWTEPEFLERMIAASTCPDFVVDRGHDFGGDLSDADKEALISFLKTF